MFATDSFLNAELAYRAERTRRDWAPRGTTRRTPRKARRAERRDSAQ